MHDYIQLTIIPSVEISPSFLMGRVMQAVHLAIVDAKNNRNATFAVAFPDHKEGVRARTLGNVIRVFGSDMGDIKLNKFLSNMADYVCVSKVKKVPQDHTYGMYHRLHSKSSHNMATRYAKRHGVSYEEAMELYAGADKDLPGIPYVSLRSSSNGIRHSLFVKFKNVKGEPESGDFSSYGLSKGGCVPVF